MTHHDTADEERGADQRSDRPTGPNSDRDRPVDEQRESTSPRHRLRAAGVPKWAGTLLLVALLLPFLLFAVPQAIGADHSFVILSGSMEPVYSPGDVVFVSDSASVQVGDVITFDGGDTVPITHRIIGVEDGQYITKGDANENADSLPVPPANVLGRVVLSIPLVGYVILWANTGVGQILLVVIPLVALGVSSLYRWANADPEADQPVDVEPVVIDERSTDNEAVASDATATDSDAAASLDAGLDALAAAIGTADTTIEPAATAVEDEPVAVAAPDTETVAVTAPDLTLTLVSTAILAGYASWNVVSEVGTGGAPEPASVMALTAGVLGVGFALWSTIAARRARSSETGAPSEERPPEPTAADGGVDVEEGP